MNFLGTGFQKLSYYKQTDTTENICHAVSRVVKSAQCNDIPDTGTVKALTVTSGPGPASVIAAIVNEYVVFGSRWCIFLYVWFGSSTIVFFS